MKLHERQQKKKELKRQRTDKAELQDLLQRRKKTPEDELNIEDGKVLEELNVNTDTDERREKTPEDELNIENEKVLEELNVNTDTDEQQEILLQKLLQRRDKTAEHELDIENALIVLEDGQPLEDLDVNNALSALPSLSPSSSSSHLEQVNEKEYEVENETIYEGEDNEADVHEYDYGNFFPLIPVNANGENSMAEMLRRTKLLDKLETEEDITEMSNHCIEKMFPRSDIVIS
jgi:hypothetical protein